MTDKAVYIGLGDQPKLPAKYGFSAPIDWTAPQITDVITTGMLKPGEVAKVDLGDGITVDVKVTDD